MLTIRDPRAAELAKQLARANHTTMTQAVVTALENELARERQRTPLAERLAAIADDLAGKAGPNGRRMTKDEIDEMWGH